MILNFNFKNFLSYKDEVNFSMIASKEKQHGDRLSRIKKYNMRILPVASIYGGNATGKTNLCKAFEFCKKFIVNGVLPDHIIPVTPFGLDEKMLKKPSFFQFEILVDEVIFEYKFEITEQKVLYESLIKITSSSEKKLYERKNDKIILSKQLKKDKRIDFLSKSTRNNQLFLTNSVFQDIDYFKSIYNWFKYKLIIIYPKTQFFNTDMIINKKSNLYKKYNESLKILDTGIEKISMEKIPFDALVLPERIKNRIISDMNVSDLVKILGNNGDRFVFSKKNNEIVVEKMFTYHKRKDKLYKFEISQESDGTKRIIDLLPAILKLSFEKNDKVYIFDEFNRSFHTLLSQKLIEIYLENCNELTRSQFVFTTHDSVLLNQKIFRRDEMWLMSRDEENSTEVFSIAEFNDKIRYDNNLLKIYLSGRLGGVPDIENFNF